MEERKYIPLEELEIYILAMEIGSLSEPKTWATKSKQRNLLSPEDFDLLYSKLQDLHRKLNQHIKSLPI